MAWWGWFLLLAYLPLAALQAVWLGHVIDGMERREAKRLRKTPSSARRRVSCQPHAGDAVMAGTPAEPSARLSG